MLEWILVIILVVIIIVLSGSNKKLRESNPYYHKYVNASEKISKLETVVEDQERIIAMQKKSLEQYETLDDKAIADIAYIEAKQTIAEIKEIQKNIEKLIAEIRELCFGFNPNKTLEKK